jgi:SPW repeat
MKAWRRWQDYATMVFGVLLFASPFVFNEHTFASLTAWVLGVLLVVAGIVAASTREPRRSLIVNAPGLVAVIMFIDALAIANHHWQASNSFDWGLLIPPGQRLSGGMGVALTAGVMAIATVVAGATLRLSPKK